MSSRYVVGLLVVLGALGAGCPSCGPKLPPQEGCQARTYICRGDQPMVCSATGRYHPVGDITCGAIGGVCMVNSRGVAACGRR